jgi:hypothetical protein
MTAVTIKRTPYPPGYACAGCGNRRVALYTIATPSATISELCPLCLRGLIEAAQGWALAPLPKKNRRPDETERRV